MLSHLQLMHSENKQFYIDTDNFIKARLEKNLIDIQLSLKHEMEEHSKLQSVYFSKQFSMFRMMLFCAIMASCLAPVAVYYFFRF